MSGQRSVAAAVSRALRDAPLLPRDAVAVALVSRYATLLDAARGRSDEPAVASDLGPKLLAGLAALGMTPSSRASRVGARAAIQGVESGGSKPPARKIDELRARRAARQHRTSAVDTAASGADA